jgi:hypothetical protein
MIIGISGKKQSGKNTTANILHGIVLKERGLVKDFEIDDEGKLIILTTNSSGVDGWGEFDITRKDRAFVEYAEQNMWPYIKLYSFADALKSICVDLFNIPERCVYGTEEQKNQIQEYLLWENMPGATTKTGAMTAREFLQYFGTEVMRKIWEPVWVNKCLKDIKREDSLCAIIADVRFPNEVSGIKSNNGVLWRLGREVYKDSHYSETALDGYNFDINIPNQSGVQNLVSTVKSIFTQ